jgi:hypothetical protein
MQARTPTFTVAHVYFQLLIDFLILLKAISTKTWSQANTSIKPPMQPVKSELVMTKLSEKLQNLLMFHHFCPLGNKRKTPRKTNLLQNSITTTSNNMITDILQESMIFTANPFS